MLDSVALLLIAVALALFWFERRAVRRRLDILEATIAGLAATETRPTPMQLKIGQGRALLRQRLDRHIQRRMAEQKE
jgi:hypothetical protein